MLEKDFDKLEPVCSNLFNIKVEAKNRGDNIRPRARIREIFDHLGLEKNGTITKTLMRHYNILHLFKKNIGDYVFREPVQIIAINEEGYSITFTYLTECGEYFKLASPNTINKSIQICKPIPFYGVKWSFRRI